MVKSGLIFGVGMFMMVLGIVFARTPPLCACCFPLIMGLGTGYLTGVFDKPLREADALRGGAGAGAIAGLIALFAYLLFGASNSLILLNPNSPPSGLDISNPFNVWALELGIFFVIGLVNMGLTSLIGVWGCRIWYEAALKA